MFTRKFAPTKTSRYTVISGVLEQLPVERNNGSTKDVETLMEQLVTNVIDHPYCVVFGYQNDNGHNQILLTNLTYPCFCVYFRFAF